MKAEPWSGVFLHWCSLWQWYPARKDCGPCPWIPEIIEVRRPDGYFGQSYRAEFVHRRNLEKRLTRVQQNPHDIYPRSGWGSWGDDRAAGVEATAVEIAYAPSPEFAAAVWLIAVVRQFKSDLATEWRGGVRRLFCDLEDVVRASGIEDLPVYHHATKAVLPPAQPVLSHHEMAEFMTPKTFYDALLIASMMVAVSTRDTVLLKLSE